MCKRFAVLFLGLPTAPRDASCPLDFDEEHDRLVAYRLDASSAIRTMTAGTMVCSEKVVCYLI